MPLSAFKHLALTTHNMPYYLCLAESESLLQSCDHNNPHKLFVNSAPQSSFAATINNVMPHKNLTKNF